jgi:hypothetical protein
MLPRKAWWKKALWIGAGAVVLACSLVATLLIWMTVQGKHEWEKTKAALEARGEKLTLPELAYPPIPDEQNFFADPMWQELADIVSQKNEQGNTVWEPRIPKGRKQLDQLESTLGEDEVKGIQAQFPTLKELKGSRITIGRTIWKNAQESKDPAKIREAAAAITGLLRPYDPILTRVEELSRRSGARWSYDYRIPAYCMPISQAIALLEISKILHLKAVTLLAQGDSPAAARLVLLNLCLAKTLENDPFLICFLVRVSIVAIAHTDIAEGIKSHAWDDATLAAFDQDLARITFVPGLLYALRSERAEVNRMIESVRRKEVGFSSLINSVRAGLNAKKLSPFFLALLLYSPVISYYDQTFYNHAMQDWIDLITAKQSKGLNQNLVPKFIRAFTSVPPGEKTTHLMSVLAFSALTDILERVAIVQTQINQARIACALERYRLKNGGCPQTLDSLSPAFLGQIPDDPIIAQPMHYRLIQPDQFMLWSVGWNLTDEGGKNGEWKNEGDIVWGESLPRKSKPTAAREL